MYWDEDKTYLVRPMVSKLETLRIYLAHDLDALNLNHQIYVPNQFVFGNLRQVRRGFVLNGVVYQESPEGLREYQKMIESGTLEVVREVNLKGETLQVLRREGSAVCEARKKLVGLIEDINFTLEMMPGLSGILRVEDE